MTTNSESAMPDFAPVPEAAFGPALNEQGYYVGRVERNLFWVTDGTYQSGSCSPRTESSCSTLRRRSATTCAARSTRSLRPRA
jgi:hypothetical protein